MLLKKTIWKIAILALFVSFHGKTMAQTDYSWNSKPALNDNIYMTWDKNTPETEMNDDIKALAEKGITIKYSNIKRNSIGEITAIKMEYSDRNGNQGSIQLDNLKPINTLKFFKQGDELGFGEPTQNQNNSLKDLLGNFGGTSMKGFNFNFNDDENPMQQFNFSMPDSQNFAQSKSKIIIKKDGKKPLVIEDGEVVDGAEDYTPEEIEEIKKNNRVENLGNGQHFNFNFDADSMENLQEQMEKLRNGFQNADENKAKIEQKYKSDDSDLDQTKKEMLKAKEEMLKAKEDLEKAKSELEKAKSTLKTRKA